MRPIILGLTLCAALLCTTANAEDPPRLWSNPAGATFEASLLWFDGKTVFLKEHKHGRELEVALDKFSDADQNHLADWQASQKKAKIGFEFGLISESYRHKGLSKIKPQDAGRYFVDGNQGKGSLSYTFKPRGGIPPELLAKKPRLMLRIDDQKNAGTKAVVSITYGGTIVGKKKGLKKGAYRFIDLAPNFWGKDDNIELEISVTGSDGVAIRTKGTGFPARLVIPTK